MTPFKQLQLLFGLSVMQISPFYIQQLFSLLNELKLQRTFILLLLLWKKTQYPPQHDVGGFSTWGKSLQTNLWFYPDPVVLRRKTLSQQWIHACKLHACNINGWGTVYRCTISWWVGDWLFRWVSKTKLVKVKPWKHHFSPWVAA